MHASNIILALVATAQVVYANSVQEKTKELKEMWGNLKAYPTLYTETGKIRVEDRVDMVDGTSLCNPAREVANKFFWRYEALLEHIPTHRYLEDYPKVDKRSIYRTFDHMGEGAGAVITEIYAGWKTTSIHKDLTSKWTKAYDLIAQNT